MQEGAAVVASEVRDRLEVGLQAANQSDDLDIALGFPIVLTEISIISTK
jgi:hypothetical protein